jgi:hypothetical protein
VRACQQEEETIMAAITIPQDWRQLISSLAAIAGANIALGYACVIGGANPGEVIQSSAGNQIARGFLQEDGTAPAAGDAVTVWWQGIVFAVASAAIAVDVAVMTAAGGKIATYAAGGANAYCGFSLAAAAADTEQVPVRIAIGITV